MQVLPGEIRVQEAAEEAHEESTRFRGRASEAPVRSVRCGTVIDETTDGAQTQSRGREGLRVRYVRQEVRQQGELEHPQADAHRRQTAYVSAVRPRFYAEDFLGPASAVSLGSEALSVPGLRQGIRVQHLTQEASQST